MKNWLLILAFTYTYALGFELETVEVRQKSLKSVPLKGKELSIEELGKEEIEKIQPDSLDDILKATVGATTTGGPRSSAEAPQIRGLDSKKIFLYIDGVRQALRTDHTSVITFDPDIVKAVEVYKSPGASLKGGSVGGGIVLRTKDPSDYLTSNQSHAFEYQTGFQSANQEKKIALRGVTQNSLTSLSYKNAEDIKLSNKKDLPKSSYEDINFLTKIYMGDYSFNLDLYQRKDPTPLNPTLNPPTDIAELNSTNTVQRGTFGLKYEISSLETNVFHTIQTMKKKRESDSEKEEREVQTTGMSLLKKYNFTTYELELGLDSLDGRRGEGALESYPAGQSFIGNFGSDFNYLYQEKFLLSTGLRLDYYELKSKNEKLEKLTQAKISKKAGINFYPKDGLDFSYHYSEGFNAPRIQDVYAEGLHHLSDGFFVADNFFIPNEDLRPETSKFHEIGMSYTRSLFTAYDQLKISFQAYRNELKDYIYLEKIDRAINDGENGTTQFVNIPNVRLEGQEYSIEYIYDPFEFSLSYARVRGKNLDNGNWIANLPADQFLFKFQYYTSESLSFGYLGNFVSDQNRVNPHTTEIVEYTPTYVVHSLFTQKKLSSGLEINARVDNLTNREYRKHGSFIYEAGVDLKLGLKYTQTFF